MKERWIYGLSVTTICALCRGRMCMSGFASIVNRLEISSCSVRMVDLRVFQQSFLVQCAPTGRICALSICRSGIHMCTTTLQSSSNSIVRHQFCSCMLYTCSKFTLDIIVPDSSRAPPPSLLRALCYGTAASTSKSCLFIFHSAARPGAHLLQIEHDNAIHMRTSTL
jgi:hypothetical protein